MNHSDTGIQLCVNDGTFYRELWFGGLLDIVQSPECTPFGRPKDKILDDKNRTQLDLIIDWLADAQNPEYMQAFHRMIIIASGEIKAADSSYA